MNKLNEIAAALSKIRDEKLIEEFLKSILTKNETHAVSSRWALTRLLDEGVSQRTVAKKLHLSLCKITRGSKELQKKNSAFKTMIDQYNKIKPE